MSRKEDKKMIDKTVIEKIVQLQRDTKDTHDEYLYNFECEFKVNDNWIYIGLGELKVKRDYTLKFIGSGYYIYVLSPCDHLQYRYRLCMETVKRLEEHNIYIKNDKLVYLP